MSIGRYVVVMSISIMVFAPGSPTWPQSSSTTSLRGTIVDPINAVVLGADVALANPDTGFARTMKTDERGVYQFLEIPPNTYSLTIRARMGLPACVSKAYG